MYNTFFVYHNIDTCGFYAVNLASFFSILIFAKDTTKSCGRVFFVLLFKAKPQISSLLNKDTYLRFFLPIKPLINYLPPQVAPEGVSRRKRRRALPDVVAGFGAAPH